MSSAQIRAVWVSVATIAIVGAGQLVLFLTPYELFRTVTPESRLVNVLIEAVWLAAVVVLILRQPTSRLWMILLLWTAVGEVWVLGYIPLPGMELAAYLLGDLWAAVFIHLVLAYRAMQTPSAYTSMSASREPP